MLTHDQVWRGIDRLALRNELSASGLAKKAGLDPTTFNKSKRITKEGKLRWPSTESLAKILDATTTSMGEFVGLIEGGENSKPIGALARLQCLPSSKATEKGAFDAAGFPGEGPWEEIDFPMIDDPGAYVIELDEDVAPPTYCSGDLVVVSPRSSIRRGDRIVLQHRGGGITFAIFLRRTAQRITIAAMHDPEHDMALDDGEIAWMARITWVSQ